MKLKKTLALLLAVLLLGASMSLTASALEPHGTGILLRNWLTNDPNYTFSEGYKSSVWYDNFASLSLTGNTRNDIMAIAISQLGYHEGEDGDYTGTNTTSSGNCVEYYRLLIPTWSNNSDEWCACFVTWCLNQAHVDYASSEIGCWKWVGELKAMKMYEHSAAYGGTYIPQPADMIFFNWKYAETKNNASSHIGYVLYTTDTTVYTIEGNSGNQVRVNSYALDDPNVIGYGTPPYDEKSPDPSVPLIDHSYKDGMPRGEYVVSTANANLYQNPGSERICRMALGSRVTLLGEIDDYAKVIYDGKIGYLPKSGLYLLSKTVGTDTLTYDANGGENAPAPADVPIGESATITEDVPTLEGDTFLGWSYVPYNYKVDVKAGDTVTTMGDTTLYAVWEKHSLKLAEEAIQNGGVAEFERPTEIQNSSAILLDTLTDLSVFDSVGGDTVVDFYEDETAGRVLSFVSTGESSDPYTVLSYRALCDSLQLAPITADRIDYIVLKVKDVSLNNLMIELFYDCGEGAIHSVRKTLKNTNEWQYLVFDMTEAEGWDGNLERLRIDWQKAANVAGNTLLISEICFAANEATADAIQNGQYVFPPEAKVPVIVETQTESAEESSDESDTSAETDSSDTSDGTDSDSSSDTETASEKATGCKGTLASAAALSLIAGPALVFYKKKEN